MRPFAAMLFVLILARPSQGQAPKAEAPITPAEARAKVGKRCTVEMTVKSAKDSEKQKEIYLDSEDDFRAADNLAIVIKHEHLAAFKKAGIEDPAQYYADKTIRVKGVPKREGDFLRIRVTDPKSIAVVEAR